MTNRRKFLKDITLLTGGLIAVPNIVLGKNIYHNLFLPPPTSVGTAISIAQFALSSSKLFQGASTSGISELQIKMLENISRQLNVLQETLTLILENLNEVKTLINNLPVAVVNELTTANIRGNIHSFDEIMRVFANYKGKKKKFIQQNGKEIQKLIESVRKNRNVLMNYDNYLNIPVMSSALYIEYNCMNLIDEKEERIIEAIRTYSHYFKRVLYNSPNSLEKEISLIRQNRTKLCEEISQTKLFNAYIPSSFGYGWHYLINGQYSFSINNSISDAEKGTINELIALGLINNNEMLVALKAEIKYAKNGTKFTQQIYDVGAKVESAALFTNLQSVTSLPTLTNEENRINNLSKKMNEQINLTTNQLYSAVSCMYSGNRSLNFCQQFQL